MSTKCVQLFYHLKIVPDFCHFNWIVSPVQIIESIGLSASRQLTNLTDQFLYGGMHLCCITVLLPILMLRGSTTEVKHVNLICAALYNSKRLPH